MHQPDYYSLIHRVIIAHILYARASQIAQLVKNLPTVQETLVRFLGWEDPLRRERLPTPVFWPGELHGVAKSQTRLSD